MLPDLTAWRTLVERDLKGAPASRLTRRTDDGLVIEALYSTAEALAAARDGRSEPGWKRLDPESPPPRPFEVDGHAWHLAGAGEAQEVGIALAAGVDALRTHGLEAADRIGFTLAVGTRFFESIAKLRAFRVCWVRILQASGADTATLHVRARPSERQWTRYDPHLNLLRNTVAVFAGAIGGADEIVSLPFDGLGEGSDTGRRLARNTAAILAEESHLDRVLDPAGGSHFIEALTTLMAEAAWKGFQAIETRGGLSACRPEVEAEVAAVAKERARRIATRKQAIVGISEFATQGEPADAFSSTFSRDAEPFEILRDLAAQSRPAVYLATLGDRHAARVAFVTQLLAAGGITAVVGPVEGFAASGLRTVCLCGHDDDYATSAEPALATLRGAHILMAGAPGEREKTLRSAGVERFIVLGGDAVETLAALLEAHHD